MFIMFSLICVFTTKVSYIHCVGLVLKRENAEEREVPQAKPPTVGGTTYTYGEIYIFEKTL